MARSQVNLTPTAKRKVNGCESTCGARFARSSIRGILDAQLDDYRSLNHTNERAETLEPLPVSRADADAPPAHHLGCLLVNGPAEDPEEPPMVESPEGLDINRKSLGHQRIFTTFTDFFF